MTEQFREQGGAATMDPGRLRRALVSRYMTRLCRPERLERQRARAERRRQRSGQRHVVEYFHQPEDGYSHLAAQLLGELAERYDVDLVCHLVSGPRGANSPEPALLQRLSRYDASMVAPEYGLEFPAHEDPPATGLVTRASAVLANLDSAQFVEYAARVGGALWFGNDAALAKLETSLGSAGAAEVDARIAAGDARQRELGHYAGAMFYYGGEWYWGVDRLYHLEQRLASLGADRLPGRDLLVPRPSVEAGPARDDGRLTLEIYPSLRSPYTAISFDRAVALARDSGVRLVVRPVLPMVMRGAPITRQKGIYIFQDTAREARAAGVPFGNFRDPIGAPVRRGYSLYPWACEQGRGVEFLSAFLYCAFAGGVNTNTRRGLRRVVERAGLDWREARGRLGTSGWENELEVNRLAMYGAGLWGVPSFRLLDVQGEEILALWGQDRLWLIAREIQRQLQHRAT